MHGSISQTRIVVHEDGSFYFQVLLRSKEAGTMETIDHFLSVCEIMANVKGEYKFCPGIDPCEYQTKYFSKIRYDVKNLRRVDSPFERIDSCNCLVSQASQECKHYRERARMCAYTLVVIPMHFFVIAEEYGQCFALLKREWDQSFPAQGQYLWLDRYLQNVDERV
jgi:hypothetical protein